MWFSSLVSFILSRLFFHLLFHLLSLVSCLCSLRLVLSLLSLFVLSCLVFFSSVFSSLSLSSFSVFVCCCGCVLLVLCVVSCLLCVVLWCGAVWCVCGVVWCDTIKTSPCVHSKRPRVCRHHAHMLKHMCAGCRHTRRRFGRTHGVHG